MKRFILSFVMLLMSLVILPANAQTTPPSIAEIVSNNSNYSLLLQAVSIADPIVLETLSNPGELTLFAPTNQAFRNLAAFFGTDLDTLLADPEIVTELLLYHVSPQALNTAQIIAFNGGALDTLSEARVRVNVSGVVIRLNDVVRIINPLNQQASNGFVHTLSDMIFPFTIQPQLEALSGQPPAAAIPEPAAIPPAPIAADGDRLTVTGLEDYPTEPQTEIVTVASFADRLTIAGRVVSDSRYSTLELILREVAPDYLDLLNNPDVELTLLAPTNSAFTIAFNTLGIRLEDALAYPELLRQILAYHVVEGAFPASAVRTLNGQQVGTILASDDTVEVFTVDVSGTRITLNDSARVTTADRFATNGVIHTVDNVLLPQVAIDTLSELGLLD